MSNIGKSHWGRRLADEAGFEHIECDALIEQKLMADLAGRHGTKGMAQWMGQPFDAHYPEASHKYLTSEKAVMQDIITRLRAGPAKPLVIDTTGSVIYTGSEITDALKKLTRVIYFETSPAHTAELFTRYASDPKPVIWDTMFTPLPGEAQMDALQRCYRTLLESRARQYAQLAHVTVPYEQHRRADAPLNVFLGRWT